MLRKRRVVSCLVVLIAKG